MSLLFIPAGTAIYKYRSGTKELVKDRVARVGFTVNVGDRHGYGLPQGWVVWTAWGSPKFAEVVRAAT